MSTELDLKSRHRVPYSKAAAAAAAAAAEYL